MSPHGCTIRPAVPSDADDLFPIVVELAISFTPERRFFEPAFREVLGDPAACLLVAEADARVIGYLLGFRNPTFFANGPVSWVEEVAVHSALRRRGVGRTLMEEFERWAASRRSRFVALATRRAAEFYRALGYEESATYFRKLL
ncbi:MAG: GNAT family N-acetyltransferase [Planctomycetota bacterium]